MIISPGRRYIFVHAPKTGGTSMALALEARAMKDDMMLGDTPKSRQRRRRLKDAATRGRLWKHSTLADIDGLLAPGLLEQMFVFTLVRNPWARMVSYYHWLQVQQFAHPAVGLARRLSFADFAQHPQITTSWRASPARHYVTDAAGQERCHAFVRLEHVQTDLAPVEAHLGFALTLPHLNQSGAPQDWRSLYTPAARAAVTEACAEDIARFDYRFDEVARRS
ncbi:MAG: sulfotransferase family 2 domain-containing protein [Pseudomonadota bacterium]